MRHLLENSEELKKLRLSEDLRKEVLLGKPESYNINKIRGLLERGADPNYALSEESGLSTMHLAAYRGKPNILQLLIEFGGDVNIKDSFNQSPMFYAEVYRISTGHTECVKILINEGANIFSVFNDIDELYDFFDGDLNWVKGTNSVIIKRIKRSEDLFGE